MKPSYLDNWTQVFVGDSLELLRSMSPQSVHMCVTSPPFWGLRSYLPSDHPDKELELGTERTPEEYVERLVEVFRALRDVLRDDGTLFLNLGSSYWGGGGGNYNENAKSVKGREGVHLTNVKNRGDLPGFKPKDLIPIPWLVGLALQRDGWYLRADNIWNKPNTMPSSVTDRPTISHEYILMFSKKPRYFFDQEAVRETYEDPSKNGAPSRNGGNKHNVNHDGSTARLGPGERHYSGRNIRSVWTIATKPFSGSHYACFPPELVYPCVKAGTSQKGVCGECGAPWVRVVERPDPADAPQRNNNKLAQESAYGRNGYIDFAGQAWQEWKNANPTKTVGWQPSCTCGGPEDLEPGDLEVIRTHTGKRNGYDPSKETGRSGMNRPRGPEEGQRLITRYEQRRYALQLRESPHKEKMRQEAGSAFAHYIRTDRSGARHLPEKLLEAWIDRGWLQRVSAPSLEPPETIPATVLDPFMGSGTTAYAARKLGRKSIGFDLNERNLKLIEDRLGYQEVLL